MKSQAIFSKVVKHLLKQNEKSVKICRKNGSTICLYRGPSSLKCAIGCLIKDKYYNPDLETKTCGNSTILQALSLSGIKKPNISLLGNLQICHDNSAPDRWEEKLNEIAKAHKLKMPKYD